MRQKILIVEDEKELAHILCDYLAVEGFDAVVANDGEKGLAAFYAEKPDLLLLDIMLPKIDGITLCKKIREQHDTPVIMISAKSGEMDKVIALGIGADDYVTKPFSPLELVARVKASLRRYGQMTAKAGLPDGSREEMAAGELVLNKASYSAAAKGENLDLTTKEFDILYYLASNPDRVLSKEQIYSGVWGYDSCGDDSSVTVYVKRLREKLGRYGLDYIKTVWGAGYKFSVDGTARIGT